MFNKTRKLMTVIVSAIIATALMISTMSLINVSAVTYVELASTKTVSEVLYGNQFTIDATKTGAEVSVRRPDGTYAIEKGAYTTAQTVDANQIGNYLVTYYSADAGSYEFYSYNVRCYMEYDYKLVVDGNGAALPTVMKKDGTAPVLPGATLYYYDEDYERYFPSCVKDDPNGLNALKITVVDPEGNKAEKNVGDALFTEATAGIYFITYQYDILGGKNTYSQEFKVKVQSSLDDTKAPVASISGISSTASINVESTLPQASITDDYDEIIAASVKVTHDFGDGEEEIADVVKDIETGYAKKDADGNVLYYQAKDGSYDYDDAANEYKTTTDRTLAVKASFDNDSFMSFIPAENGTYKVTYGAKDDAANEATTHSYTITVSDTTGPQYYSIDDELIPTKWGTSSVAKLDEADEDGDGDRTDSVELDSIAINFPIPEIYDNVGSDLSCSFTVTDANSRQIIYVKDILRNTADDSSKVVASNYSGDTLYFCTGAANTFKDINLADFVYSSDNLGAYTVKYVAKDADGNTTSKTIDLTLTEDYTDVTKPTLDMECPDYFAFRNYETTETITDVSATDNDDSRLNVTYTVNFGGDDYDLDYVDGYTSFTCEIDGGVKYATFYDVNGKKVKAAVTADNIIVKLAATDSVGNVANTITENISVIDATEDMELKDIVFDIMSSKDTDAQGYVTYGSIAIDFNEIANRNYTGFELYVQQVEDKDGKDVDKKPLDTVEFDMWSDNGTTADTVLHIDNIKFKANVTGKYMLVLKAFNVTGKSQVFLDSFDVNVTASSSYGKVTGDITSSIVMGSTYDLPNNYYGSTGSTIMRHIKGGRMSIMGTEFTALQACGYSFEDYVISYANLNAGNYSAYESKSGVYNVSTTNSESPVFTVLGVIPSYVAKDSVVLLPAVSAATVYANADEIECVVRDADGNQVDVTVPDETKPNEFQFTATKDGDYTVTYTASVNDKENSTSFTISCGKVTSPEFDVEIGSINDTLCKAADGSPDATVGDLFKYATINVKDEDTDGYKYSKTLLNPEGEEVSDSNVTTATAAYNSNQYELSMAGTYTVVYTVTDDVGNDTTVKYYINVTSSSSNVSSEAIQTLTIVLIIVGVIIIAGVIIYFVKFRKRKI